jgi:hypothetical protein
MKQDITHGVQDRSIAHVGGRHHVQPIHDACDSGNSNRKFQGQFLRSHILRLTLQGEHAVAEVHANGIFV